MIPYYYQNSHNYHNYHKFRYPYYNHWARLTLPSHAYDYSPAGAAYPSLVMSRSSWIERGPDGRAYYVKSKSAIPSLRQKFAEAFYEFRQRNQAFGAEPSASPAPQQPPAPAPSPATQSGTNTPRPSPSLKKQGQNSENMPQRGQTSTQKSNLFQQPSFQPPQSYPFPPFMQPQANNSNNGGMNSQNVAVVPHYAAPHPSMYPYITPGCQALAPHASGMPTFDPPYNFPPGITGASQTPMLVPAQVRTPYTYAQPNAGRTAVNPGDLNHKCSVCGRFRSSRYQRKHRLAPGQLPSPTVCRRCRHEETESEDESSDRGHRRSHSRHRSGSRGGRQRQRSRARSSSRGAYRNLDFDYYATRDAKYSSSDSDASDRVEAKARPQKRGSSKGRNQSGEVVLLVDDNAARSPPHGRRRRVVYLDDSRDREMLSDDGEEVEVRYVEYVPRSRSVSSRPGTPAQRLLSPQFSEPEGLGPMLIERRVYYDERPPLPQLRRASSMLLDPYNQYTRIRSSSRPGREYTYETASTRDDDRYYERSVDDTRKDGMRGGEGRDRSRSRVSIDEGAESGLRNPLPLASTPPGLRRKRPVSPTWGYGDGKSHGSTHEAVRDGERRTSSRSRHGAAGEPRGAVDEVAPADDYDWYDADGMKVRVREI